MMSSQLSPPMSAITGLIAMAFLTLAERKLLSYSQLRKGPNKPSFGGYLVPVGDATKLLTKEMITPTQVNKPPFYSSPTLMLLLALAMWSLIPLQSKQQPIKYSMVVFLCLSSLSVYTSLAASWSSNSKYALLGTTRNVAQTISYEVNLALIMVSMTAFLPSLSFFEIQTSSKSQISTMMPPLYLMWFMSMLAELNRAPFDLVEGESELVSGFNTEYGGGFFTMIFMAEYLNIMMMSIITLIMSQHLPYQMMLPVLAMIMSSIIILIRSSYPRMRYNSLMTLNWIYLLPLVITLLILITATH